MPAGKKIDLHDALEDSPQTQAQVASMESSILPLKDFVFQLKETSQSLHDHQAKVSETVNTLANILSSADDKLFGEKDLFMVGALRQLGKYVAELYSWQEMLCSQLDQAVVQQLDSFLSNDLTRVTSLKEAFHSARGEHDQSMIKYNRVSKKKETERSRFDANSELFATRRRFHQSSLQYYAELNNFQMKKKFAVLDPMLAFMHSQLAYFKMGHEILTDEVGKFLTTLNVEIQKAQSEHDQLIKQQKQAAENLEHQSAQLCVPDPDPSDPFVEYQPANLQLQSKSGYLLYRQQGSKWERIYFYTKGHLLYWQQPNRAAEVLLDLTSEGVDASSTDIDDRRYVFQIIAIQMKQQQPVRRPLYFQAESGKSRDEWIATIVNIVSKRSQPQPQTQDLLQFETRERTDSDLVRMERERVRTFVKSQTTSKLPSTYQPEPIIKQQQQVAPPTRPPPPKLAPPPPRPPLPQQEKTKQSRPPPPPIGGSGREDQQTVQKLLELSDYLNMDSSQEGYLRSFVVRYLGSLEVDKNKGVDVIKDTIRRIIAARALKNIMGVCHVNMVVTHRVISLTDIKTGRINEEFKLKDVSYCAKHPENEKLFGMIARNWQDGKYKFICYVFESETSGKELCQAVIDAIRTAVKLITGSGQRSPPPTEALPTEQHVMNPPTSPMASVFNTPPEFKSFLPKSLSTGSFRGHESSRMINLPEEDVTERDSGFANKLEQQDHLIDFMSDSPQQPLLPPQPPTVPMTTNAPTPQPLQIIPVSMTGSPPSTTTQIPLMYQPTGHVAPPNVMSSVSQSVMSYGHPTVPSSSVSMATHPSYSTQEHGIMPQGQASFIQPIPSVSMATYATPAQYGVPNVAMATIPHSIPSQRGTMQSTIPMSNVAMATIPSSIPLEHGTIPSSHTAVPISVAMTTDLDPIVQLQRATEIATAYQWSPNEDGVPSSQEGQPQQEEGSDQLGLSTDPPLNATLD